MGEPYLTTQGDKNKALANKGLREEGLDTVNHISAEYDQFNRSG
jgi:hypothetical protein